MSEFDDVIGYALAVVYGEEEVPEFINPDDLRELTARLATWTIESFIKVEAEAEASDEQTTDEQMRELMEIALSVAYIIGSVTNPTNPTEPHRTVLDAKIVQRLLTTGSVTLTIQVDD